MSEPRTCPCGAQTSPDPSCDMCDGWTHDPDTGWGGFYDGYKGKHYSSEEEQQADYESDLFGELDSDEDDETFSF